MCSKPSILFRFFRIKWILPKKFCHLNIGSDNLDLFINHMIRDKNRMDSDQPSFPIIHEVDNIGILETFNGNKLETVKNKSNLHIQIVFNYN